MDQYTHPQGLYKEFIESGAYRSWEKFKGLMLKLGRNKYSNYLGNSMAKANIPGFSEEAMKQEAAAVYLRVQQAQAQMQADLIRDVVSKDVFIKLRAQTSQRRTQGWNDIHWEMLDQEQLDRNIQIVQKRAFKFFEQSKYDYLQFTLCISSKQRFAAYGSRGDLLAGDPQQVLDVTEYCVFERKTQARVKRQKASLTGLELSQPGDVVGSRWRLVGWLNP